MREHGWIVIDTKHKVTSKYMHAWVERIVLSSSYHNDLSHERGHDVGLELDVIGEEFSCEELFFLSFLFLAQPCC